MYKVENIISKEITTKFGPKPVYTVMASGERYSAGFKKPGFKIGDTVAFTVTETTYGKNIDEGSVRVITEGSAADAVAPAPSAAPRPYGPPAKVFPIPPLHGDRAIVRQNSLTNAVNLLRDELEEDATDEEMAFRIIAMARRFEAYSCGDLDLAEAMKETA